MKERLRQYSDKFENFKCALILWYALFRLLTQNTGCPKFIHSQIGDRRPRSDEINGNSVSGTNARYALKFLILQNKKSEFGAVVKLTYLYTQWSQLVLS